MDVFDWQALRDSPLISDPYEHVIVSSFLRPEVLSKVNADYPTIEDSGSFSLEGLRYGASFRAVVDALESEEFRAAFEEKFHLNLSGLPTTLTVRGHCGKGDGQIHTDSVSKVISILIYTNPTWQDSGGRLRLLRARNIDDTAAEVVPAGGNLVAFRRSERSWHGHLPFTGERRVIQFNWVANRRNQSVVFWRHRFSALIKHLRRSARSS